MYIKWFGPVYSLTGYAEHNRRMVIGLSETGEKIKLIASDSGVKSPWAENSALIKLEMTEPAQGEKCLAINLVPTPPLPVYGDYSILYTTLETRSLHPGCFRRMMLYDEIWVPCKFNYNTIKKAGIQAKKLRIAPEGVDSKYWAPSQDLEERNKEKRYTFLSVCDWSFRKGVHDLVKCFCNAFKKDDNVKLIFISHYKGEGHEKAKARMFREFLEHVKKSGPPPYPEIEIRGEHITDEELLRIYNSADCYVLPTYGEAWSLTVSQAMSCGLPVITTNAGGHLDFCNKKNALLIDVKNWGTIDELVNLTVDFYQGQEFSFPDTDHLTKLLKYCYNNPWEARKIGIKGMLSVRKSIQWERAVQIAKKHIEDIKVKLKWQ